MTFRHKILRLFGTSAFRLTALYLVIFLIFSGGGLYYFYWQARSLMNEYISTALQEDSDELLAIFQRGGIGALDNEIAYRINRGGEMFYSLTTRNGFEIRSNINSLPLEMQAVSGWYEGYYFQELDQTFWLSTKDSKSHFDDHWTEHNATPSGETKKKTKGFGDDDDDDFRPTIHLAMAKTTSFPAGLRLLIARNADEVIRLDIAARRSRSTALILMLLFGITAGFYSVRRVMKRVDGISNAMDKIAQGELSGRLPLKGSGDELDRIAGRVNLMLERIERLMHGLQEVSDNIAHDLKTPLTRLRNKAEEALRGERSEDDLRSSLGLMVQESDQLIRVFEALLQIARVEAGNASVQLEVIEAKPILEGLADLFEPLFEEQDMTVEVTAEAGLYANLNRDLIGQALSNLIENVLKYGTKAGTVLSLSAKAEEGQLRLAIADQGGGIPQSEHERVLGRFTRLNPSRTTPGSGLGLSLVAAVAKFHGGKVELADNQPGLEVALSLPLASAHKAKAAKAAKS